MRRAAIAVGIIAALLAGSCGGGELPARLATTLQDRVAAIRERAEAGQPGRAGAALRGLVELVTSRLESGQIDEGRALEILEAAEAVEEELALLARSPSPSVIPSSSPSEEDEGGGDGEGNSGEGKGKGNNGGDQGHGNDD
jgi:hypothetical protein